MKRTRRTVCSVQEHVLSHSVLNSSSIANSVSFSSVISDPSAWEQQFIKYVILITYLVVVRDVNESRLRQVSKKFSGSRKKFLDEKFLDPKFAPEQMWALKCLRTRHDVFVLCWRLTPSASPPATLLVSDYPSHPIPLVLPSVYLMPLISPPPPPSFLGNYVTRSTIVCIASSFPRHCRHWQCIKLGLFC